jgi:cytochrome c5
MIDALTQGDFAEGRFMPIRTLLWQVPAALAVLAFLEAPAAAQGAERSGKEVVESVCAACHGTGAKGAPKIGDKKAWAKRAQQGLTSLTQNALKGIRQMPSHGGKLELTDLEIGRAVAYMVNQSGGRWTEPASLKEMAAERSGRQVVEAQCIKCHKDGKGGAPRIGDRAAWTPRLKDGIDSAVRAAIRGHGGMPPRGDKADLTDAELRSAVLYMVNPAAPAKKAAPPAAPAGTGMQSRTIEGVEVNLGFVSAEALRKFPEGSAERSMHGGVPSGSGYYHVNVSLLEAASKAPLANVKVEVRLERPGLSGETKALEPVAVGGRASYGNYFRLLPKTRYVVIVHVQKPDSPRAVEARFEHRTN